jgi:mRNA-degrading endonuclease RelE of RelBE toxin-antitoxin system
MEYNQALVTVVESPLFTKLWPDYWVEEERGAFAAFIAGNPEAGDLIRGSGGCRKVRWGKVGTGKRGGVRVIYALRLAGNAIVLLVIYSKSVRDSMSPALLRKIAEEMGHAAE